MPSQVGLRNRILSRLSAEDYALLGGDLEFQKCGVGAVLIEADTVMPFVYFLESGIASVVAQSSKGRRVEAGIIGREGFVHPAVILGADRIPTTIQMQLPDDAHRIPCQLLLEAAASSASLRRTLLLFAQVNSVQASFTILTNSVNQVSHRLARWLLMFHDRSDSDDLPLTNDFISVMLAVRRPSVTNALHVLEGNRLIRLERGHILVRNRAALEIYAGDAYGIPEAEYRRLLGPL